MKLGKDEYQKIFLGFLLLAGLLYCYFTMLLGPLDKDETDANTTISEKGPKVEEDKKTIRDANSKKADAAAADATLEQIKSLIPGGAPVAWFPPLAVDFFSRQGIDKCVVHHGDESVDKDLPGFKNATWEIDVTRVEIVQLALAIAAFENEHPLMEINSLQIQASKENVQYQTARLSISTTIKQ